MNIGHHCANTSPLFQRALRQFLCLLLLSLSACPEPASTTQADTMSGETSATDATSSGDSSPADVQEDAAPVTSVCVTDTDCAAGICACDGRCVEVSTNPCNVDINCAPGNFCDPCTKHCAALSGLCEPCGGLSACSDGGACMPFSDGGTYCGLACLTDAGCPTGYTCTETGAADKQCIPKSGSCADLGLCDSDGDCVAGEVCNEVLKLCAPGCSEDTECPNPQLCVAARCSDPCTVDTECEAPKECTDGRCKIPGACEVASDCPEAETYCNKDSGTCEPGCLVDDHCGDAAKTCKNGTCVAKGCVHNYQCSFEQECDKATGQCIPMTRDHCAPCDSQSDNPCDGSPNLCVSFEDQDGNPQGDFCLLLCADDEVDQCPQGYGCQKIEVDGTPNFYCVRQCWQDPVGG